MVMMIRKASRQKAIVILFLFLLVAGGCAMFFSGVRFMLPVLPLYYLVIADYAFQGITSSGISFPPGLRPIVVRAASIAFAVVLVGATIWSGARHIKMFIDAHPVGDLGAAEMLEEKYGTDITVLGTYPFTQRYVGYRYVELEHAEGIERVSVEAYYDRLERQVLDEDAAFVIIGRATISSRPLELLHADDAVVGPPDFLVPIYINEHVALYEVRMERH
jgi:hypothetical protein